MPFVKDLLANFELAVGTGRKDAASSRSQGFGGDGVLLWLGLLGSSVAVDRNLILLWGLILCILKLRLQAFWDKAPRMLQLRICWMLWRSLLVRLRHLTRSPHALAIPGWQAFARLLCKQMAIETLECLDAGLVQGQGPRPRGSKLGYGGITVYHETLITTLRKNVYIYRDSMKKQWEATSRDPGSGCAELSRLRFFEVRRHVKKNSSTNSEQVASSCRSSSRGSVGRESSNIMASSSRSFTAPSPLSKVEEDQARLAMLAQGSI